MLMIDPAVRMTYGQKTCTEARGSSAVSGVQVARSSEKVALCKHVLAQGPVPPAPSKHAPPPCPWQSPKTNLESDVERPVLCLENGDPACLCPIHHQRHACRLATWQDAASLVAVWQHAHLIVAPVVIKCLSCGQQRQGNIRPTIACKLLCATCCIWYGRGRCGPRACY